jgi:hypothetical protein
MQGEKKEAEVLDPACGSAMGDEPGTAAPFEDQSAWSGSHAGMSAEELEMLVKDEPASIELSHGIGF